MLVCAVCVCVYALCVYTLCVRVCCSWLTLRPLHRATAHHTELRTECHSRAEALRCVNVTELDDKIAVMMKMGKGARKRR